MPTLYSFGKAKIVGTASVSDAAGVNNRRSAAKADLVTGFLTSEAIFLSISNFKPYNYEIENYSQ
jgi:hypothetical protein